MVTASYFRDVDDRTEELRDLTDQHPEIFGEFLTKFELSWIYHENAMEGIVTTHAELVGALKGRPIAPDTYLSIRNQKLALDLVRTEAGRQGAGPIDAALVERIHDTLGANESVHEPGVYRKFIPLHRTYFHDIAQPASIEPRMQRLMDWAAKHNPEDEDAIRFAAQFHHEFMSVFPYPRHSGKLGRALVNYILLRHGYLPVIFHANERQRYYETLRHNARETEQFVITMMINCVENASTFIHKTLEDREQQDFRRRFANG
jgi:Fic family protein